MSKPFIEITSEEMDALLKRIQQALDEQLSLTAEDIRLILNILQHFAFMQEKLESDKVMKQKYLKLLGLVNNSETQEKLLDPGASSKKKTQRSRKKRPAPTAAVATRVCHHSIERLEKGQRCPACDKGQLYKFEPASFVRIIGSPPLVSETHVMEQLRCSACGQLFTADLPPEVSEDGLRGQKYGYSARAMISLGKFFMGSPYYRQGSLQQLLGGQLSASSAFDQCRLVANDAKGLFDVFKTLAANAPLFYIDDTGHKILDQDPIEKPTRRGKGTRLRSGIYTSGLIATLDTGRHLVLFQTNIGHAGEWADEVLKTRDANQPAPQVVSDALASNRVTVVDAINVLCNAHSRRKFTEVISNFPEDVAYVLERYGKIWSHEHEAQEQQLSATARRDYHHSHSLPIMEALRDWGKTQLAEDKVEANSGLGKAINYLENHFEGLTAFCHHEGAPIDNNFMEGILKMIATSRKNFYFYKTLAGAKVGDVITSMVATCELNGVNAFDYLVAIQRHRYDVSRHPESWLPWNYSETLENRVMSAA